MGNSQARQRIKARDFDYLAKYTGFVTCEVLYHVYWDRYFITSPDVFNITFAICEIGVTFQLVEEYFDMCMDKYPDGKMDRSINLHSKFAVI